MQRPRNSLDERVIPLRLPICRRRPTGRVPAMHPPAAQLHTLRRRRSNNHLRRRPELVRKAVPLNQPLSPDSGPERLRLVLLLALLADTAYVVIEGVPNSIWGTLPAKLIRMIPSPIRKARSRIQQGGLKSMGESIARPWAEQLANSPYPSFASMMIDDR